MAEEEDRTGLTFRDVGGAVLVSVAVLFFYGLVLLTDLPAVLPGYPAVIVSFLIWCIIPGWFLQRWLFAADETSLVEQVGVAFLMSMALVALPALVALQLHWSLDGFAIVYAVLASLSYGATILWRSSTDHRSGAPEEPEPGARGFPRAFVLVVIMVPLLAVLTSPLWSGDRIARDSDDLTYMTFVNQYLHNDSLDASAPALDAQQGAFGRMNINSWVVVLALVAETSDTEAFDLLFSYIPPLMTALVVAVMFALGRGLFRSTQVGLLAALYVLVYAAMDMAPHEGYGRNVLLRIGEDKMVASYVLLPVGLLLAARFLSRPTILGYVALLAAAGAVVFVHPMAFIFLGIAFSALAVLHMLAERTAVSLRTGMALLAPGVVVAAGFTAWWLMGNESALAEGLQFRRQYQMVDLASGFVMGNYHLILHPFMLAAIVLALPVWLQARRGIGNQVVLASVAGALLVFFVPIFSTPVAEAVTEQGVWRVHWLIPVPLVLGYATHLLIRRLPASSLRAGLALTAIVGGAFILQEQYAIPDDAAFYNRTSDTTLLPWTGGSIFLGGVERAFSSDWRPDDREEELLSYLLEDASSGDVVLLPADIGAQFFPGVLDNIEAIVDLRLPGVSGKAALAHAFYQGPMTEAELVAGLNTYSVDYVILDPRLPCPPVACESDLLTVVHDQEDVVILVPSSQLTNDAIDG